MMGQHISEWNDQSKNTITELVYTKKVTIHPTGHFHSGGNPAVLAKILHQSAKILTI
jgi:hypothetical protein